MLIFEQKCHEMLSVELSHVFILTFIPCAVSERRIVNGQELTTQKRYMVYLAQAQSSPRNYDTWVCGGAIVSPWFILTSAACVEDVQNMYAVAGYKRYVKLSELDINNCTKYMKRKIVYTCVPEAYELTYNKVEKWSKLDIAIVKVEKPYKFNEGSYIEHCSYIPNKISINFDETYEKAGTNVIVLGWGHSNIWRKVDDKNDYNQEILQYASTMIYAKAKCKEHFKKPDLSYLIDKYMICTYDRSNINDYGKVMNLRKSSANTNETQLGITKIVSNETQTDVESSLNIFNATRRQGICQNDHGGPLVTWVNGEEQVIGVASVFRVNAKSECVPPFLHTSTAQNKIFIKCVLEGKSRRSSICDKPASEKGFKILRRHISWRDHSDGPAESEKIHRRPQIPINYYGGR